MRYLKTSSVASFFVLIIAICSINAWQLVLPNFSNDNSYSIAAAKNIYDGKGYTLTSASPDDLSITHNEPINQWPPGYSWLLVLIRKLTDADWITSCYILNAIGATLLILALKKIFQLLQIPAQTTNIYLLFAAFIPYPFLSYWFSDLLAVAFFMWGMTLLLQVVTKNKHYLHAIVAGILFGYCACLKYLYIFICPIPFIILFVHAWQTGLYRHAKSVACGGICLALSLGCMLWFQHHHTGAAFYVNPTGKGFFPENLLHLGPVVPASLLDFQLYDVQLSKILHVPYPSIFVFWKWLNLLSMAGMAFLVIRYYQKNGFHMETPVQVYINLALAVSIAIIILLSFLSLTQAPYSNRFTPFWTYVEELRYYAVVLIFIPQGIVFLLLNRRDLLPGSGKILMPVIFIIVAITIGHGSYYLTKQVFIKKEFGKNRTSEKLDFQALRIASGLSNYRDKLVICSDSYEWSNLASLSGIPVLYEYERLNTPLHASKPLILLAALDREELPYYRPFFSLYHPMEIFPYKDQYGHKGINYYIVIFR